MNDSLKKLLLMASLLAPVWALASSVADEYFARISYADAVQLALQKNFAIEASAIDPLISRARLRSDVGKFDPALTLAYTYDENEQDLTGLNVTSGPSPADGLIQPGLITRNTRDFAEANIGGLTPWGMNYELGVTLENRQTSQSNYLDRYSTFAGFSLTQPVLRGFGTDVNMASVRIARANVAISKWAYALQVIDTVTRVAEVYNELWFSSGYAEVERRSRNLAAQLAADNQRRAEIGVMSPLDVLQAETDVAAREERVLVAEREQADDENFLKQLVTNRVEDVLKIRLEIDPPPKARGISADRLGDFASALEYRPDYQVALLELQKKKINVVFTRNSMLPQLDLVASLGSNGLDRDLADSINQSVESGTLAMSFGGVFSIPIPNNTAIADYDAAKLEVARQLVELKRLEQSILVEADNAAGRVETAAKRIEAARTARQLAARTLEAGETRLRAGTATTFEVLQFQRDLANAAISEIRAMADYNIAVARYQQAAGITLVRNNITLPN